MNPREPGRPLPDASAARSRAELRRTRAAQDVPQSHWLSEYPHLILAPLFRGLFRVTTNDQREWYYPTGSPVVSVPGVDPVRILLLGDSAAAGCGVLTHHLGLAGHLARHVAEHLDRGVVVRVAAQPGESARSILRGLRRSDLDGYDAIVLMLAVTDAFCLTRRRSWQHSVAGLVDALEGARTPAVFVTGAATMELARPLTPFARRLTGTHARMLNAETRRICAASRTPMIPLDAANDLTPRTYATWARRIGGHIIGALAG